MASTGRHGGWLAVAGVFAGFISLASAQSIPCIQPPGGEITDLQALANLRGYGGMRCDMLTGSLTIHDATTTVTSGASAPTITLPFTQVQGSLELSNLRAVIQDDDTESELTIDTSSLVTVDTALTFSNLRLATMPDLRTLVTAQNLTFADVTFSGPESTDVAYSYSAFHGMTFQNCAGLTTINASGFPADSTAGGSARFVATGNADLTSVNLSGYNTTTTDIIIQNNLQGPTVKLDVVTGSLNLAQVAQLQANQLHTIEAPDGDGASQVISDNTMKSLSLPALVTIQDTSLEIFGNMYLDSINFSNLQDVSTLNITDNTGLNSVILRNLTTIGTLLISGPNIETVTLPIGAYVNLQGQVNITAQPSVCQSIQWIRTKGKYTCQTFTASPGSPSQSSGSGGSASEDESGGSSGLSTGAKAGIGVGVGLGGLLLLGVALFFIFRRRKRSQRIPQSTEAETYSMTKARNMERSPTSYSKVPAASESADEPSPQTQQPYMDQHPDQRADYWAPTERRVSTPDGAVEMEEQQGPRHEMDARSLPDMEIDDDDEETRSLQDIERSHGQSR